MQKGNSTPVSIPLEPYLPQDYLSRQIEFRKIFSLSNSVFQMIVHNKKSLLLKVYQDWLQQFTDRDLENKLVHLISQKSGYPKIYGSTKQFRIEEYLKGQSPNINNISKTSLINIVSCMANFTLEYSSLVSSFNISHHRGSPRQIKTLFQIFKKVYAQKKKMSDTLVSKCEQQILSILDSNILDELTKDLEGFTLILNHNDTHLGNVIISESGQQLLLDYQFSQFNYIGFDLGNFFNEFATVYEQTFQIKQELELDDQVKKILIKTYFSIIGPKLNLVQADYIKYVSMGRVLSHLFWMFVGLKQIDDKRITFDMVYYVKRRYQEFLKYYKDFKFKHR